MITNERQYRIGKAELEKLGEEVRRFHLAEATRASGGDRVLAKAQLDALESESEVLSEQLREYEALKAGSVRNLEAASLSELPGLLIKARIALGLSQRQLAERMRLKEQQIQRYEAEDYTSASLRRLIEVSDALGLKVVGRTRLRGHSDRHPQPSGTTVVVSEGRGGGRGLDHSAPAQANTPAQRRMRATRGTKAGRPTAAQG